MVPYGSKCLLRKYLGYDLGGQVPSQTVELIWANDV